MKVKKTADLGRDGINIARMYIDRLKETCNEDSAKFVNCLKSFGGFLQEVVDLIPKREYPYRQKQYNTLVKRRLLFGGHF